MEEQLKTIHQKLVDWFQENQRGLPWRLEYHAYQVMVSEFMAQQTRMETVIPFFQRWMKEFPDIESLAKAPEEFVLKYWEGLGYYRRCRNLLKAANEIVQRHHSQVPKERKQLEELPGIGPYTAGAIASIAYNQPETLIDGNVKRVFSRLIGWDQEIETKTSQNFFLRTAEKLIEFGEPRNINQGLMEFGALICKPQPDCDNCFLKSNCHAYATNQQAILPVKKKRPSIKQIAKLYLIIRKDNQLFLIQQEAGEWWEGMWNFPSIDINPQIKTPRKKLSDLCNPDIKSKNIKELNPFNHSVTRYKIKVFPYMLTYNDLDIARINLNNGTWFSLDEIEQLSLPKPAALIRSQIQSLSL